MIKSEAIAAAIQSFPNFVVAVRVVTTGEVLEVATVVVDKPQETVYIVAR